MSSKDKNWATSNFIPKMRYLTAIRYSTLTKDWAKIVNQTFFLEILLFDKETKCTL